MSFTKIGAIFPIAQAHLTNPEQWNSFKKKASIGTAVVDETIKVADEAKEAVDKNADFQVVADIDTNKFVYIHTTIMAGVKTAGSDYWVTPETEKYINDNHDAWKCADLLKDYHTFRRATTFVEHDQNIERAKGRCIDAIARKLPDTVLIDVLFSVDKRHDDLVNNITAGIINSVSMGCTTEKTVCSVCGNEAPDSDKYCAHIRNGKGQQFICKDGSKRKAAELCVNNTFFDVSLVANPAFAGAIFRKILSSSQASSHLLANILNAKIETVNNSEVFLKAASKDTEVVVKADGTVNVKEADKVEEKGTLTKDEMKTMLSSFLKEEKTATNFLSRIVDKFFGKKSSHPIENISSGTDFNVPYGTNFEGIEKDYHDPHNVLPHFKEQDKEHGFELNKVTKEKPLKEKELYQNFKRSHVERFTCHKCGYEADLWQVKAASVDLGYKDVLKCPDCSFFVEASILHIVKQAALNKNMFVANQEIPLRIEDDNLIFDRAGEAVIAKGEKLQFVTSKDNVGAFKTELGEIAYLPIEKKTT